MSSLGYHAAQKAYAIQIFLKKINIFPWNPYLGVLHLLFSGIKIEIRDWIKFGYGKDVKYKGQ